MMNQTREWDIKIIPAAAAALAARATVAASSAARHLLGLFVGCEFKNVVQRERERKAWDECNAFVQYNASIYRGSSDKVGQKSAIAESIPWSYRNGWNFSSVIKSVVFCKLEVLNWWLCENSKMSLGGIIYSNV